MATSTSYTTEEGTHTLADGTQLYTKTWKVRNIFLFMSNCCFCPIYLLSQELLCASATCTYDKELCGNSPIGLAGIELCLNEHDMHALILL